MEDFIEQDVAKYKEIFEPAIQEALDYLYTTGPQPSTFELKNREQLVELVVKKYGVPAITTGLLKAVFLAQTELLSQRVNPVAVSESTGDHAEADSGVH